MEFSEKVSYIQTKLKAPKGQYNSFGNYKYRSCEDILEAVKPLLDETKLILHIDDDVVMVGTRYYIKATATLTDTVNSLSSTAYAREEESKKKMDGSQVTGAASSYARKYALNGLLAIDDTKDSDSDEKPETNEYKCESCGMNFQPFEWNGKSYTAGQAFEIAKKRHGKALCKKCAKAAKEE